MQEQKSQLDRLAQQTPSSDPSSSMTAVPYLLLLSLFVWSPSEWAASHHSLLLHCLRFALSQKELAGSTGSSSEDAQTWKEANDDEMWVCVLPMVRYFGLLHRLQEQLKGTSDVDWAAVASSRYAFSHWQALRKFQVAALCLVG